MAAASRSTCSKFRKGIVVPVQAAEDLQRQCLKVWYQGCTVNAVALAAARTVLAEGMVIAVGIVRKLPCMQYDGVMSYSCKLGKCLWSIVIIVGSTSMNGGYCNACNQYLLARDQYPAVMPMKVHQQV